MALTITDRQGPKTATRDVTVSPRAPGEYAPGPSTTGVPSVVADRLCLVDLELPGKGSGVTPPTSDETLYITKTDTDYVPRWKNKPLALPPEHLIAKAIDSSSTAFTCVDTSRCEPLR